MRGASLGGGWYGDHRERIIIGARRSCVRYAGLAFLALGASALAGCASGSSGVTTTSPTATAVAAPVFALQQGTTTASSAAAGVSTATCPAGSTMVGGGFANKGKTSWTIDASYPSSATSWSVHFHTAAASASPAEVVATALCMTFGRALQTTIVSGAPGFLNPNVTLPDATCPSGSTLLSGGYFYTNQGTQGPAASYPASAATWRVVADSEPAPGGLTQGTVYALCGHGALGQPAVITNAAGQSGASVIAYQTGCPSGDFATAGGFNGGPAALLLTGPAPTSGYTTWAATSGAKVTAYALCARFLLQG